MNKCLLVGKSVIIRVDGWVYVETVLWLLTGNISYLKVWGGSSTQSADSPLKSIPTQFKVLKFELDILSIKVCYHFWGLIIQ